MSIPQIAQMSSWTPSSIPTKTTLSSIDPTHAASLLSVVTSVVDRAKTETNYINLRQLSETIRGAEASLTIIGAEEVLATATDSSVKAKATEAIFNATLNLKALEWDQNLYGYVLSRPANIIYLVVFTICFFYVLGMVWKSRYHWFNITFCAGLGLEFAGFLGRVLSFSDDTNINFYLLQYVSLTIAPAFLMGGIYFLFAQVVVIHGRQYSILKPMWYSYLFIACDVLSLLIQAGGGGSASIASKNHTDTAPGTHTMIAGIVFQVVAMTVFLVFWFEFLQRIYFKNANAEPTDSPLAKKSIKNFFKLLFNAKEVREYRAQHLEKHYNIKFQTIRERKLFPWFPLAITGAVVAIYIRCVYRVVELAQGFSGYLISHEVYLMVLDALMIAICALIFIPFHPVWAIGTDNVVRLAHIKKNQDEKDSDLEDQKEEKDENDSAQPSEEVQQSSDRDTS
ncbi:putative transporter or flippase transmembrane protein [Scheffersomyces xylosifermentans]|uniref:putative transporter or flippase transmembrane protein n=1 Tax=Scheffersomyces xylosifermentans TaxID=1304137 RepID=UPI00315DA159